jgi:flagellar protein FlbT
MKRSQVNDIIRAAPSSIPFIDDINNEILTGQLYKALRAAKKLIQHEQDTIANAAAGRARISTDGAPDGKPT